MPQKKVGEYSYSLEAKLGSGSSSTVFQGRHDPTGRPVALKVHKLDQARNDVQQLLLDNEVRASGLPPHPNIVRVEAVVRTTHNMYFVMEYCAGGTLEQLAKNHPLPEDKALVIMQGLARGLLFLQQHGVLHRDMKSSNVLLSGDTPKICDFGYCDLADAPRADRFYNVGSPAFMSPEVFYDNAYSPLSDVWGLGVILHELLTGKHLLQGEYKAGLHKFTKEGLRHLESRFSSKTVRIMAACLKTDPKQRASPQALFELLEEPQPTAMLIQNRLEGGKDTGKDTPIEPFLQAQIDVCSGLLQVFAGLGEEPATQALNQCKLLFARAANLKALQIAECFSGKNVYNLPQFQTFTKSRVFMRMARVFAQFHNFRLKPTISCGPSTLPKDETLCALLLGWDSISQGWLQNVTEWLKTAKAVIPRSKVLEQGTKLLSLMSEGGDIKQKVRGLQIENWVETRPALGEAWS